MTLPAILGEVEGHVVRRPLIVRRVTRIAIGRKRAERAVRVTLRAIQSGVRAGQREHGVLVPRREPAADAVALFAGMRETLRHVAGRRLVIGGMTGVAI